ncbi:MAG TPA: hypothetical protein VMC05_06600, partial [Xanthobacteraceae bacterium]|nr:hypothetical protein [Xanthobacteraceae bacterium]
MQAQTAIHGDATRSSVASPIAAPIHDRSHTAHVNPHAGAHVSPHVSAHADTLDQTMRLMGAQMSYSRNSEIFGENEPAEYLYKVVSGSVRTY